MKTSHTPGPWAIGRSTKHGEVRIEDPSYSMPRTIAYVEGDSGNLEANARLISAAPDLLDAATSLMAWFDAGRSIAPTWVEVDNLRAAIAKAMGKA